MSKQSICVHTNTATFNLEHCYAWHNTLVILVKLGWFVFYILLLFLKKKLVFTQSTIDASPSNTPQHIVIPLIEVTIVSALKMLDTLKV